MSAPLANRVGPPTFPHVRELSVAVGPSTWNAAWGGLVPLQWGSRNSLCGSDHLLDGA